IMFDVCVEEEGQLMLTLNGTDLNYTVAGRTAAVSQISGMNIIETTSPNSIITVRNPLGNPDPLTISPSVGGERPVTAHLIIIKLI
ncbi:MAG: collagen-like protein, partial [Firmicutes bacterium]|nr:collagen-like protein [Bacillota bacterium]